MQHGSLWLFQISLADVHGHHQGRRRGRRWTSTRTCSAIRRPADWSSDPMESLAVLVTAASGALRALVRGRPWSARTGRRPSRSATACGGIASSPRWPTAGGWSRCAGSWKPPTSSSIPAASSSGRTSCALPAYDSSRQQAQALHDRLAAVPLATEDREPSREQSRGWPTWLASASSRRRSAGDGRAPRAGRADLSAAAHHRRIQKIAPQGTRPAGLLRHQPTPATASS